MILFVLKSAADLFTMKKITGLLFLTLIHFALIGQSKYIPTLTKVHAKVNGVSATNTIRVEDVKDIHQFIIEGPDSYKYIVYLCNLTMKIKSSPYAIPMKPEKNEFDMGFKVMAKKFLKNDSFFIDNIIVLDTIAHKQYKLADFIKVTIN